MENNSFDKADRFIAYVLALMMVVSLGMTGWSLYNDSPAGFYAAKSAQMVSAQIGNLAAKDFVRSSVAADSARRPLLGSAYDQVRDPLKEAFRTAVSNIGPFLQK